MAKVLKVTKETVSLNKLKENLPESCFKAVEQVVHNGLVVSELDESIYQMYFSSKPTAPLTELEQKELFEQLGNTWVKNHFSTSELRSFIDSEPTQKRGRRDE